MCVHINGEETCDCVSPYIDDVEEEGIVYCIYKAKKKLTTFLLAFLVGGTGADWFYLSCGNGLFIFAGIMKILVLCCMPACLQATLGAGGREMGALVLLGCCACLGGISWYIADWAMILTNQRTDGNGMGLFNDM